MDEDKLKGDKPYRTTRWLNYKKSEETKLKISLAMRGKIPWSKGKRFSEKTREKMSLKRKGIPRPWMRRTPSDETKAKLRETSKRAWSDPIVREKYNNSLLKTKWIKVRTDKGQSELLEKWNRLGFKFEPNYQVHIGTDLFYLDGYDKERNVVLEYDSKYHMKPKQKEKDFIRQKKIVDVLHPKRFWRYNSVNKNFQDMLGQSDGK